MTKQSTQSGYDFLFVNTPVVTEYVTAQKFRVLSELRTKFLNALKVDNKEVMYVYQSTLNEVITCSDFEDNAEEWYCAEMTAMQEAIYKAEKLEEREIEFAGKGCKLEFVR
jgi:hypothetical protein